MCPREKLPNPYAVNRTLDAFARSENPEELVDTHVADRGMLQTNDQVVEAANTFFHKADSDTMVHLLHNGTEPKMALQLPEDYDNIFTMDHEAWAPPNRRGILSRRSARRELHPFDAPEDLDCRDFMFDWINACYRNPLRMGDFDYNREECALLHEIINYLPERLDLDNWIGADLRIIVGYELSGKPGCGHEVYEWTQRMDDLLRGEKGVMLDRTGETIPFVGEPIVGRLCWIRMRCLPDLRTRLRPFPTPDTHSLRAQYARARVVLLKAEEALIALSRRIARQVAMEIYEGYCGPRMDQEGRPILTRKQLGQATREVLGEKWFDLPFDLNGSLRNWSENDILIDDDQIESNEVGSTHTSSDASRRDLEKADDQVSRILGENY